MKKFNSGFSQVRGGLFVMLHLGLLMLPISSSAANPPVLDARQQALSTIYVESVTASTDLQLPSLHSDAKELLTNTFRKQLKQEDRLQIDPTVHALRLRGVILSYRDATLDAQGTLYDDEKSIADSRVKRHIEIDGDWGEAIDLVVEQMLDELVGKMRDIAQPGYSLYFEPNGCNANFGCSDSYYVSWGWWRLPPARVAHHAPAIHERKGLDMDDRHHTHAEHHNPKPHWDADKSGEHEHKEPRATVETPDSSVYTHGHSEETHSHHGSDNEVGGIYQTPGAIGGHHRFESLPAPSKQPTTAVKADAIVTQPSTIRPAEKSHHHGDLALEAKPEIQPTVSTPMLTNTAHDAEHHHRATAEFAHVPKADQSNQASLHHETHADPVVKQTQGLTPDTAVSTTLPGNSHASGHSLSSTDGATVPTASATPSQNTAPSPSPSPKTGSDSSGSTSPIAVDSTVRSSPASTPSSDTTSRSLSSISAPASSSQSAGSVSSLSGSASLSASPAPSAPSSSSVTAPSYSSPSAERSSFSGSSVQSSVASPAPSVAPSSSPVATPSYSSPSSGSSSASSANSSSTTPIPTSSPSGSTNPTPHSSLKSEEKHRDDHGTPH